MICAGLAAVVGGESVETTLPVDLEWILTEDEDAAKK